MEVDALKEVTLYYPMVADGQKYLAHLHLVCVQVSMSALNSLVAIGP